MERIPSSFTGSITQRPTADLKDSLIEPIKTTTTDNEYDMEAYEVVKELLPFGNGLSSISARQTLSSIFRLLCSVAVLSPTLVGRVLIDTSGLVFFNMIGDFDSQTIFGIYDSYYILMYFCMITSLLDKFSIDMSVAFGEKNYYKVREIFTRSGLVCLILLLFFTLPTIIFAGHILKSIGVDDSMSFRVQELNRLSIPLLLFNLTSEYIKSMCLSQGHEQILGYTSLASVTLTIAANYFVIVEHKMSIEGWIVTKTINEVVSLLVALFVYCRTVPQSRGFVPLGVAFKGFGSFLFQALKFMLSIYPEYLGFEATMYFIVLNKDNNQIAAYNCMINIAGLLFGVGFAFAYICRTRVNILLGMGNHKAAKNYFKFFVLVNIITGILVGLALYFGRPFLARAYSDTTGEMRDWFYKLVLVYSIASGQELAMNTVLVGMKTIGKVGLLLILNSVISMIGSLSIGYVIYRHGGHCDSQFTLYMILCSCLTFLCLAITLRADWSKIREPKLT